MNGYLRIATASDNPSAMFLDVLKKVDSVDDKKLVLNEIGLSCESLEAIDMTQTLFDHPQLKATAAIAAIRIAYRLRKTMIWSPVDQDIQVEGGCDDALKIWVNGEIVFDDYNIRGGSPRTMLASARLRKGWNELKLKAVDHEGGWAFGCRVRNPNGTRLEGLKYEAR